MKLPGNPYLPAGLRVRDLEGPDFTEAEMVEREFERADQLLAIERNDPQPIEPRESNTRN